MNLPMHVEQNGKVCWDACSPSRGEPGRTVCRLATGISTLSTESLLLSVRTLIAAGPWRSSKQLPGLILVDGEVSKKETAVKVVEAALKHFDRIDLLINTCPRRSRTTLKMTTSGNEYQRHQLLLHVAGGHSADEEAKFGTVVNISAVLADQPSGAAPALLAVLSKSPMPAVSKALALEYAENNIRFNTVSPGIINTPMHAKDNHAALAKFHPLGRTTLRCRKRSCADGIRCSKSANRHAGRGGGHLCNRLAPIF
jgi:NAD(P)-dependent dehydrogenase (short-subunit alcohol dehydrogenase family)